MSLVVLVPLVFAGATALFASFYVLKKKSLAQAHCVQEASLLQTELKTTLEQLLKLNPRARALRRERVVAEKALKKATLLAQPYAIAAAKAYLAAVVLQQTVLRTKQQMLLNDASRLRHTSARRLRARLQSFRFARFSSRGFYWRGLAVEAIPAISLTPDYEPIAGFEQAQQHRFRFQLDLTPPFLTELPASALKQPSLCSVTLKGQGNKWQLQILEASASSKWSWF